MPLVAMNDYVDGIEQKKAAFGYAIPTNYPLGINGLGGLGCGGDCNCGCSKMSGLGCAECGGTCGQKMSGLGVTQSECDAMLSNPAISSKAYVAAGCEGGTAGPKVGSPTLPIPPPASTGSSILDPIVNTFNSVWGTIQSAKANKPPKQKVVVQRNPPMEKEEKPDWMMPAIIAGGVIVATVLAVSIGRRK